MNQLHTPLYKRLKHVLIGHITLIQHDICVVLCVVL